MDPVLYNAAIGGSQSFRRQGVIANNLANAGTPGFRSDLYEAQTMYAQGGVSYGRAFTAESPNSFDAAGGDLTPTGRNLDIAPNEDAWFAVRGSNGEAYTKAGSLKVDVNGQLVTSSGKVVLGSRGPISIPPAQTIDIGKDGTISIIPLGGDARTPNVVDRIKMVKLDKAQIYKNAEGMFQLKSGGSAPVDSTASLVSGTLEGSNVQPIEQMVAMITAGRDFETHMNVMSTVSDNAQKLAQILHD